MRVNHTDASVKRLAGSVLALVLVVGCGKPPGVGPGGGPKAKNWDLVVGPEPCDLKENGQLALKQVVSKRQGNVVTWKSNAGQPLLLVFHLPGSCGTPPFKDMKPLGKDRAGLNLYQLGDGTKDTLHSGPIEKEACEGPEIKYDQVLGGKECDGIIIIQP